MNRIAYKCWDILDQVGSNLREQCNTFSAYATMLWLCVVLYGSWLQTRQLLETILSIMQYLLMSWECVECILVIGWILPCRVRQSFVLL